MEVRHGDAVISQVDEHRVADGADVGRDATTVQIPGGGADDGHARLAAGHRVKGGQHELEELVAGFVHRRGGILALHAARHPLAGNGLEFAIRDRAVAVLLGFSVQRVNLGFRQAESRRPQGSRERVFRERPSRAVVVAGRVVKYARQGVLHARLVHRSRASGSVRKCPVDPRRRRRGRILRPGTSRGDGAPDGSHQPHRHGLELVPVDQPVRVLPRLLVNLRHDLADVTRAEPQVGAFENFLKLCAIEIAVEIVRGVDENLRAKVPQLLVRHPRQPRPRSLHDRHPRGRRRHVGEVLLKHGVRRRFCLFFLRRIRRRLNPHPPSHQRLVPRQRLLVHRRTFAAQRREAGQDHVPVIAVRHREGRTQVLVLDCREEKAVHAERQHGIRVGLEVRPVRQEKRVCLVFGPLQERPTSPRPAVRVHPRLDVPLVRRRSFGQGG